MIQLLLLGLLSGLFFSSTFILNRAMSLAGGSWVWSGSLRYLFMIILLMVAVGLVKGPRYLLDIVGLFRRYWFFWIVSGTIGFGFFYALCCYGADHAPGWVIASTWQLTIIASLFVLMTFGRSFPRRVWLFSGLVFAGVLLVNLSEAEGFDSGMLLHGGLPVLVAAFCYPTGNQLVWEATNGNPRLPAIDDAVVHNPFAKVLLLSIGSVPFWLMLILVVQPPPPSQGQLVNTLLVAFFSGILATSLFLLARSRSSRPGELAAVDATQSSEVIFALLGEMLLLGAPFPGLSSLAGIALVILGLSCFVLLSRQ